ncbi:hypothetical protein YC2023_087084 [Brassica napus]
MVRSFDKEREEEINILMEKLEKASSSSSTVKLSQFFITLTSDVMSKVALGRKYSSDEGTVDIKTVVRTFSRVFGSFPVAEYIPSLAWIDWIRRLDGKAEEVSKTFDDFLEKVVQEHDLDVDKKRSGRRLCPAIRLALVLVEVTVANLVKRFDWRVQVGPHGVDKLDLAEAAGIEACCNKYPLIVFPTSVVFPI